MAFTLSTIYKAVDKMSPILKQMERANTNFANKQNAAYNKLRGTMSNVSGQLLSVAGGLSIGSLLYTGTSAVTKFDESLNSLSAITGMVGSDLDILKKEVVDVANRTKKAGYDVNKAFELVGSAQPELLKDAKALSKVTEAAIVLSKASKDSLEVSARNVTGVLNQFSLGAEHANRAINVLSAGSVVGAANISEITEAMKNSGTVMADANLSMEQGVALLEVLGKYQLKGAEAGTKARGVILKLQKAQLGYQSGIFNINDAIDEANKKMALLTNAKERDAFAAKIFGAENITAGKIILNNKALFDEYTKGVTGTNMAYKQAEINTKSFNIKLQELKARFENLIIKGNENSKILDKFGKVIDLVTRNLDKILVVVGTLITAFGSYYILMTTIRAATLAFNVATGLMYATQASVPIALAASSVAMKAYAIGTKIASAATWLFSAALWANPITWIVIGIIALVAAIVLLIVKWKEIINWIKTSNNFFAKFIRAYIYPFILYFKALKFAITWVIDKFKIMLAKFKETKAFDLLIKSINAVKFVFKSMGFTFKWVWGLIVNLWEWIKKISGPVLDPIMKLIDKFSKGTQAELNVNNEKPVNTQAASSEANTNALTEMQNNLAIELTNKTDKNANVKTNSAKVPITTNTF
jgi:TP901 family phage tail tape measure protein